MAHRPTPDYDVIVVGAGHAGCEAAHAAARLGMKTLLVTINLDAVAQMSCNPAIGGLAKGHLVREIDALGGIMARAIDATGIQFRMLNTGKGPAVHALRAQADKRAYSLWMKQFLEQMPNLDLRQAMVEHIHPTDAGGWEIELQYATRLSCRALILTTGTFLDGLIHIGLKSFSAGRAGEFSCDTLSSSLSSLGLELGRLKTGTPARLDAKTIDFSGLELQRADEPPPPFSFTTERINRPQVPCHITYTNPETHRIIRDNLDRSPLYSGKIVGIGPRYCPSIEDKVMRFADKERHQIFLEPEGLDTNEIYANGISSSLPEDVQIRFMRTIKGLEQVVPTRPAYAIEYTFVPPTQLGPTLEVKDLPNLFLAGQINGTSGYEEAAGQGMVAAINAARKIKGEESIVLTRADAYIGVMIDDLVTKGTREPYRMFTSRAEYRLLLRQDNADLRLTELGYKLGLIDSERYSAFCRYREQIERELERLRSTPMKWSELNEKTLEELGLRMMEKSITLAQFLARPEVTYDYLVSLGLAGALDNPRAIEQVTIAIKYAGYIAKQAEAIEQAKRLEQTLLPEDIDYAAIKGLRKESAEKLSQIRPRSIGQASRISGVNPADVTVLLIYLKTRSAQRSGTESQKPKACR